MPIVTNATPRGQQAYGSFQPRADQSKFRSAYAIVEGQNDGRYPHLGQAVNDGIPFLDGRHSMKWDVFEQDGKPHDVRLSGGQIVREVIITKEDAEKKEKMEGEESERNLRMYTARQKVPNRSVDGLVTRQDEVLTDEFAQSSRPGYSEAECAALEKSTAKAKSNGWTPERRAAAAANLAKARAAKSATQSQPATT